MKHRKVKEVAQGHTASKWQSQDTNPSNVSRTCVLNLSALYCLINHYDC